MRRVFSPFSFGVNSNRVFTCTLNRIRKGINHSFNMIGPQGAALKTSVLFYETVVALIMLLQAQKSVHLKLCACPI